MTPAIQVRDVSKFYAEGAARVKALEDVSLDVFPGEVVLLMGPSGSGKTTLLSIMGCILRASSGSVKIAGRETATLKESQLPAIRLRHIGFIFQAFNLFPTLSAAENVELALGLKGIHGGAGRKQARALLEEMGLSEKYQVFPADLSGGQKQRVAIARALAGDPEIILADEPTAALDSASGRVVMEKLRMLARDKGRAVVIVTHDNRILDYGNRIIHIEDGRIGSLHGVEAFTGVER